MSMDLSLRFPRKTSRPIASCPPSAARSGANTARWTTANGSPTTFKVGKLTSFPRAVKLKPGETVVFAWITYKSRAQRDKINAKVMADPRLKDDGPRSRPPFDGKRMIYGGFESLVKV